MDSFKNASKDKDNILDNLFVMQRCSDFYYKKF